MKSRSGFVSNSSSSSFIIKNKTNQELSWEDFVDDIYALNKHQKFNNGKSPGKYKGMFTKKQMLDAKEISKWKPKECLEIFTDDEDYENPISVLRSLFTWNRNSDRFSWCEMKNSQNNDDMEEYYES